MDKIFEALLAVNFPDASTPLSKARRELDVQLKDLGGPLLQSPMLRAWLLMNLKQSEDDGSFGWKFNVQNIHEAYRKHFADFKIPPGSKFEGETVFIGGEMSIYIPKTHHEQIRKLFPSVTFEYVKGAGHWVHSEKPKEFMSVMDKYL